jgi:hypothetical protein
MMENPFPDHIVLQDFLGNLSAELLLLAAAALEIEEKVGDVIADGMSGGERLLVSLQGLDHLVQTANELAAFIAALSQSADGEITIPVTGHIQSIGLRSLAESLVGQAGSQRNRLSSRGEVDLF